MTSDPLAWAPTACTLPTQEQPLRLKEFDDLLASALKGQQRESSSRLRWLLDPASENIARDLARRETQCCSFFTFSFAAHDDVLIVDIDVPATQTTVLDALEARAISVGG